MPANGIAEAAAEAVRLFPTGDSKEEKDAFLASMERLRLKVFAFDVNRESPLKLEYTIREIRDALQELDRRMQDMKCREVLGPVCDQLQTSLNHLKRGLPADASQHPSREEREREINKRVGETLDALDLRHR